jgi:hypothetical protein
MRSLDPLCKGMAEQGFTLIPGVFPLVQVDSLCSSLKAAFQAQAEAALIRSDAGSIYAARNVLSFWPDAAAVWHQAPLPEVLTAVLGPGYGLVRALFFDKPPERTWALPWHKDLTVAVRDNRVPSRAFARPTLKAGVPHVEAPEEVLEQMATVRIHLDDVTEENGPLKVIPGSHHTGKELRLGDTAPESILCRRGDVLVMRPLLAHSSGHSNAKTSRHRRIVHLEFAGSTGLPDGYCWYDFRPGPVVPVRASAIGYMPLGQ